VVSAVVALIVMLALLLVTVRFWQSADAERIAATNARDAAEVAKMKAEEAETAIEAQKVTEAALLAEQSAKRRATNTQSSSADLLVASYGRDRDSLRALLDGLERATDPFQIAILGQSVALLADFATSAELEAAMQTLIQKLMQTSEPSSATGIAQALRRRSRHWLIGSVRRKWMPL
jgi:hypothetical protein